MSDVFAPGLFTGRHALITGGGTGIGFAIAEELGRLGARVSIAARTEEKLARATDALQAQGVAAAWYRTNIRQEEEVERLFESVIAAHGLPDILVNNAGGQFAAQALDITPNGFRAVMDLNVQGTWHMSHAWARRAIAAGKGGRIINIVFANIEAMPNFAHAAAARAANVNLTKTLALEWGRHGILVNAVGPGVIGTPAIQQYSEKMSGRRIAHKLPVPRVGTAREVALAVAYLCSPAGDYVTGIMLPIDGGISLTGRGLPD
ncbi:MAG: SDR family oxidoreductase [Alphaproteobacteria bacterium]|nr:SDR family oxidoreductase [Alphaproteobacteria bacterium]